jgi:hypothetical protein
MCHPILYSFVSWRAGRALGRRWDVNPSTQRLTRSEERRKERVQRGKEREPKGCRRQSQETGTNYRLKGLCSSSHDQYTGSREGALWEEIVFLMTWNPKELASSCSTEIPASLARRPLWRCMQAWYFAWLAASPPPPSGEPSLSTYILQKRSLCVAYLESMFNHICDNFRYYAARMDGRQRGHGRDDGIKAIN